MSWCHIQFLRPSRHLGWDGCWVLSSPSQSCILPADFLSAALQTPLVLQVFPKHSILLYCYIYYYSTETVSVIVMFYECCVRVNCEGWWASPYSNIQHHTVTQITYKLEFDCTIRSQAQHGPISGIKLSNSSGPTGPTQPTSQQKIFPSVWYNRKWW